MDSKQIRLLNLEWLLENEFSGPTELAGKLGWQTAQVSRLYSKKKSRRNMGDSIARRIEKCAKRPEGWMDQVHPELYRDKLPGRTPLESETKDEVIQSMIPIAKRMAALDKESLELINRLTDLLIARSRK